MNTRLTLRLTAPLLTLSVLLIGLAIGTSWYVQEMHADTTEMLESNLVSVRAAGELEIRLREVRTQLDRYLLSGDRHDLEALPKLRRETDHWLAEAERVAFTATEQRQMAETRQGYTHFFDELDGVTQADFQAIDRRETGQRMDRILMDEILRPDRDYLEFNEEQAAEVAARNRQTAGRMVLVLLLLGLGGALAGSLAGYAVAWRINRSLVRLTVPLQDATGKLDSVVGPLMIPRSCSLEEMEGVLQHIAQQVGTVVERLQQSQREALRAEQLAAVGQMAAGFAHELRNPLMSMKILVQSAAGRDSRAALHGRDLAVLEEEINRLEQLTSSLLDFARPPQLRLATVDMRDLIDDVVDLLSGKAGRRDIRIECYLPDEPVCLKADAGQLRQVLLNLLLNALDAIQKNGMVQVNASVTTERVELRIADSGGGLPVGLDKDIFAPFVSTKATGLGLGLSITKRIVEMHGGTIAATNRLRGGAEFTVRLPATRTRNENEELQNANCSLQIAN
jgi:signal transduction histidine kinase